MKFQRGNENIASDLLQFKLPDFSRTETSISQTKDESI